jgi:hypothetical protein
MAIRCVLRVALLVAGLSLAGCVDATGVPVSLSSIPLHAITLTPAALSFNGPAAGAQTFTATEPGYGGPFTLTDSCHPASGAVVGYTPTSGHGPSLTVTVTPSAVGACSIIVDDGVDSVAEDINVGTGLSVSPSSVAFGSPSGSAQSAVISQPGYTGTFTLTDTCRRASPATATYTPSSGSGPNLTIAISPGAIGECVITATDQASRSVSITVSVAATSIQVQ